MADERLVKVVLHDRGADVETSWAEDLGPADGGGRRVRLDNVPFLHAKPTFGDVIVAREDPAVGGQLAWDRGGVPWPRIGERLELDGGRYAMIVDYAADDVDRFGELSEWLGAQDLVPEGCFAPRDAKPGRLYLAVPKLRAPRDVMALLATNDVGFAFTQIHPGPAAGAAKKPAAKPKAKPPAAKKKPKPKPAAAKKKPAKAKPRRR